MHFITHLWACIETYSWEMLGLVLITVLNLEINAVFDVTKFRCKLLKHSFSFIVLILLLSVVLRHIEHFMLLTLRRFIHIWSLVTSIERLLHERTSMIAFGCWRAVKSGLKEMGLFFATNFPEYLREQAFVVRAYLFLTVYLWLDLKCLIAVKEHKWGKHELFDTLLKEV